MMGKKKNDNQIWLKKQEEIWKPILIFNPLKPQLGLWDYNNHIERKNKKNDEPQFQINTMLNDETNKKINFKKKGKKKNTQVNLDEPSKPMIRVMRINYLIKSK